MLKACSQFVATLSLLLLAACDRAPGARKLAHVSPFDSLGVRPGDSPSDLRRTRPVVRFVPHGGYAEELGARHVMYRFMNAGESSVPKSDPLRRIFVMREFANDSAAARAELRRETARIAAALGKAPECWTVNIAFTRAAVRTWAAEGYELNVGVWIRQRDRGDVVNLVHELRVVGNDHPRMIPRACTGAELIP